ETAFKMIVAELLGVPMDAVNVVQSDTALVPRGMGTMGSRSLQIGGSAIHKTSELVVDKAKRLAAHLLEADVADIVVHEGEGVGAAGAPATALSWAELAMAAGDPARRPADFEEGLRAELDFNQGEATYPFGAHIAVVEVDTETGRSRAAELRSFEHRDADPAQPARCEGHRRSGDDRLDAGGAERGRRRAVDLRDPPPRHAAHVRARVAGDPRHRRHQRLSRMG